MKILSKLLLIPFILCPNMAMAQNLLSNPGFENGTVPNYGANWTGSNTGPLLGWTVPPSGNVVQTDGNGIQIDPSGWPKFDASGLLIGNQRYLDFGNGNVAYQSFVAPCTATYAFGASFNNWGNQGVLPSRVSIRPGASATATPLAQSAPVSFSAGVGNWTPSTGTVTLTSGQTYTFTIDMDPNHAVVDQNFVERRGECDAGPPVAMEGDHYQCYSIVEGKALKPETITVIDQFGKQEQVLGRPVQICNPAVKIHNRKEFGVEHKERHLVCYKLVKPAQQPVKRKVAINNQFAPDSFSTDLRTLFCVPSSKKLLEGEEYPF